jgi:hypothetical protein
MKLEAGKRYVRRDGTITPPLEPCHRSDWLLDPETEFYFAWDDELPEETDPDDYPADWNTRVSGPEDPKDIVGEAK